MLEGKAELKAQGHSRGNWPSYRNSLQKVEKKPRERFLAWRCKVGGVTTDSGEGRSRRTRISWEQERQATPWEAEVGHQEEPPLQEGGTTSNGCPDGGAAPSLEVFQDLASQSHSQSNQMLKAVVF